MFCLLTKEAYFVSVLTIPYHGRAEEVMMSGDGGMGSVIESLTVGEAALKPNLGALEKCQARVITSGYIPLAVFDLQPKKVPGKVVEGVEVFPHVLMLVSQRAVIGGLEPNARHLHVRLVEIPKDLKRKGARIGSSCQRSLQELRTNIRDDPSAAAYESVWSGTLRSALERHEITPEEFTRFVERAAVQLREIVRQKGTCSVVW